MAKIVVIDDESAICELVQRIFEGVHEVSWETDPEKALDLVERTRPDLILLDIKMPKIDGVQLLAAIKEKNALQKVIMITGYGEIRTAMESMNLGARDYVTKPFDMEYLKKSVEGCLEPSFKEKDK